jgi:uncharacterized membrane protein
MGPIGIFIARRKTKPATIKRTKKQDPEVLFLTIRGGATSIVAAVGAVVMMVVMVVAAQAPRDHHDAGRIFAILAVMVVVVMVMRELRQLDVFFRRRDRSRFVDCL